MHSHLVAVEVGIEGAADEGRDLDGAPLDEDGLKRLNGEAVQRGRTVQEHRVILDDFFENVPDEVLRLLDGALGALDVMALVGLDEPLHDEGLEELDRHLLRETALIDLELGADDDDRTAGVVDTLAEEVLTEATLLAAKEAGERLEFAVGGTGERLTAPAVVDEGIDGFLQHALLVLDDHFGRAELDHALQAVVAVDDAAVEVIEIGGCKPAAVQLHHGAQVGGNDGKHGEDHPLGAVAALAERLNDLDALDRLDALGARRVALDDLFGFFALFLEIDRHQKFADRLRAHADFEPRDVALAERVLDVAEFSVVDDLLIGDALALHLFDERGDLLLRPERLVVHELCAAFGENIGLFALRRALLERIELGDGAVLHLFEHRLKIGGELDGGRGIGDVVEVAHVGEQFLVRAQFPFERLCEGIFRRLLIGERLHLSDLGEPDDRGVHAARAGAEVAVVTEHDELVYKACVEHGIRREINDLFERLGTHIEKEPDLAGHAAEIPDVRDGRGKFDVPHALAAHFCARDFDAALFAHDALVTDALIFPAVALPVLGGTKDLFAEKSVPLGFLRAVVDGLGLGDLAVRPFPDLFGRCDADLNGVKIV